MSRGEPVIVFGLAVMMLSIVWASVLLGPAGTLLTFGPLLAMLVYSSFQ